MRKYKLLVLSLGSLFFIGCSVTQLQNKGKVSPKNFSHEITFDTLKSLMILPFELDGVTKNFLFDTGADFSLIQREATLGKVKKYGGASKRKMALGNEIVSSLKLGEVEFKNTKALNGDMVGLKEEVPNFGGLIGQPIINKANWLIDNVALQLVLSDKNLVDNSFHTVEIKREGGSPYTYIILGGKRYKAIVDLGSSSEFNLPKETDLAKELVSLYGFKDHERRRYTLGGLDTIIEKKGIVPMIKLGDLEFENVTTTVNTSSNLRLGMAFFKDCQLFIDNNNGVYKIKKIR